MKILAYIVLYVILSFWLWKLLVWIFKPFDETEETERAKRRMDERIRRFKEWTPEAGMDIPNEMLCLSNKVATKEANYEDLIVWVSNLLDVEKPWSNEEGAIKFLEKMSESGDKVCRRMLVTILKNGTQKRKPDIIMANYWENKK